MISKIIPKALTFFRTSLLRVPAFGCSTEERQEGSEEVQQQKLDRAANFYRNSVRKINIDRQGRGKFTEHALLRLIKLTQSSNQMPLTFEAYYNYLGHFTVISSTTVDKMLSKAMDFQEADLEPVIELYSTHNYLAYFPHYSTTFKLINLAQKDPVIFKKLLSICYFSPLIKFDKTIVDHLMNVLKDYSIEKGVFSAVSKLLQQRSTLGVLKQHISRQQMTQFLKEVSKARQEKKKEEAVQRHKSPEGSGSVQ